MRVLINGIEYRPVSPVSMMPRSFGEFLRANRVARGMTLEQVAKEAGSSKSYIFELEHGRSEPSLRIAAKLCKVFGLSLEKLMAVGVKAWAGVDPQKLRDGSAV